MAFLILLFFLLFLVDKTKQWSKQTKTNKQTATSAGTVSLVVFNLLVFVFFFLAVFVNLFHHFFFSCLHVIHLCILLLWIKRKFHFFFIRGRNKQQAYQVLVLTVTLNPASFIPHKREICAVLAINF